MANVTVQDVLRQIQSVHARLVELYQGLGTDATNERARMLAQYMATREDALQAAFDRYEGDVRNDSTLAYWFKVAPMLPEKLQLDGVTLSPDITADELSSFSVEVNEALRGFVRDLADAATSLRVRELFADLMAREEREQRLTSRATLQGEREM